MNGYIKRGLYLLFIYILLIVNYRYIVAIYFDYMGYDVEAFEFNKLFVATFIILILITLGLTIEDRFYSLVYNISLTLFPFGQSIFYTFNDSDFILLIYMTIPVILIFLLDKFDFNKRKKLTRIKVDLKDSLTYVFIILITLALVVPYFQNISTINLKNLLFIDIYETRGNENRSSNFLMGYIFSPLSRVLLPFLLIYAINNKKRLLKVISLFSILMIFLLNGAMKSILVGLIAAIFFLSGNYFKKNTRYLFVMLGVLILSIAQYTLFSSHLIADYMRRIIFTPARLFQVYYDYFNDNFTYFKHSNLSEIVGLNEYEIFIPHYIGQTVLGSESLSANVGIFTEGFLSFGSIGVVVFSIVFALVIFIIRQLELHPSYFGILFSFLYVINTSFIETLLITHGLLFLMVFGYYFIPSDNKVMKYEN